MGRYWYNQGLLQPDKIVNAIVAIDSNTEDNGCMRLLSRSHKLGRIDHGKFAGQMCANPSLVAEAMRLPGFELTSLTMEPGAAPFSPFYESAH
jgi:ectoine hydroxylase-related dioxygenase (phytanoyl-CoA dioxygenase family)